jgi:membrane-associated phospholipid phosphatase
VPFFGGHYLVDMIAGAAAMLIALAVLKTAQQLKKPIAASASPGSAAASGGAY